MPVDSDLPIFCSRQIRCCCFLLAFDRSDLYNLCRIFFFVYEGVELSNGEKHRFSAWNGACGTSNLRLDCVKGKA